ncbi:MAG TPA: hypothetical protein VGS18_05695, partial [Thermoplasmata archaeon]|nr:hypothetical protein [Thermoplasmata archaeon]
ELGWIDKTRARLTIEADFPSARGSRIPSLEAYQGRKFVSLDDARYQPNDERRKAAAQQRADLEAWLATFGRPKKGG